MSSSVPLSVRISQEDSAFIANLQIGDAVTPSEKVRALIQEARTDRESQRDYTRARESAREDMRRVLDALQTKARSFGLSSDLPSFTAEWVSDLYAEFASDIDIDSAKKEDVLAFEIRLSGKIFHMLDHVLRMGITSKAPCYDPYIIQKDLGALAELLEIVNNQLKKEQTHV